MRSLRKSEHQNETPPATGAANGLNLNSEKDVNTSAFDEEKAQATGGGYGNIKMNRIGAPPSHLISSVPSSDVESETSVSVGKQMQMEAENAIKYRTCSWYKVCWNTLYTSGCISVRKELGKIKMFGFSKLRYLDDRSASMHCANSLHRPLLYSFPSTSVLLSCPFHTHTPCLDWFLVLS